MFRALVLLVALAALVGCDRNVEPYVPGEEPRHPDLSKIFPAGAEQAAREKASMELPRAPGELRGGPDPSADAEPIRGVITVAEELSDRIPEGAILYLMAHRRAGGPPLAVKRIPAPEFPLPFALGPDDRMSLASSFTGPLHLSARLDADGDAASRNPGDLQGSASDALAPGDTDVAIVLDQLL
jgi:hypothetical protein